MVSRNICCDLANRRRVFLRVERNDYVTLFKGIDISILPNPGNAVSRSPRASRAFVGHATDRIGSLAYRSVRPVMEMPGYYRARQMFPRKSVFHIVPVLT